MQRGPVDFLLAEFREGSFHGGLANALSKLVDQRVIRIIDLAFISKDTDGAISTLEVDTLESDSAGLYDELEGEFGGVLSSDDLDVAGAELSPGSAAGLIVWENLWAREFIEALDLAGGTVSAFLRIPAEDVDRAFTGLANA